MRSETMAQPRNIERHHQKLQCFSDYVQNVPKEIVNKKNGIVYIRGDLLGAGSFGKCFGLMKQSTKQRFACKIISRTLFNDPDFVKLTETEIKVHRDLKHEHIVQYIESFEDKSFVYIVQDLCSNRTLNNLQKKYPKLSMDVCRYFSRHILLGLEYLHSRRIVHRDIKLGNILIDSKMQARICDFGLALELDDPNAKRNSLCGTTNYLSPEVIARQNCCCKTDVWATGVIIFSLLFGFRPFDENNEEKTRGRILTVDLTIPCIDPHLRNLLQHIFIKDPRARFGATECLKLPFFTDYKIPSKITLEKIMDLSSTSELRGEHTLYDIHINEESKVQTNDVAVELPSIHVKFEQKPKRTFERQRKGEIMRQMFDRFYAICKYHETDNDLSIPDIRAKSDVKSDDGYWVTVWFYNDNGFAYRLTNGAIVMQFNDGSHLMKSLENEYFFMDAYDSKAFTFVNEAKKLQLKDKFSQFWSLADSLNTRGIPDAEIFFEIRKIPHLFAWFQTTDALVMLFSDDSIQINFKTHRKVRICPSRGTISFIDGSVLHSKSKTVIIRDIPNQGYSVQSYAMLKYITVVLKRLAEQLK